MVDGDELFFESSGTTLLPLPELFASALLPIAAGEGVRLVIDAALDPVWVDNARRLLPVWHRWWRTPAELDAVLIAPPARAHEHPAARVGLCFSLGVDSFYSLLRSGRQIDLLVVAEGYDAPIDDQPRLAAIRASLGAVAESRGVATAIVRTNLREHPTGRRMDWERGHGGALAAVGHACSGAIGELLISSTKPYFANLPWGSHWETDPLWSSSRLRISHLGAERRRNDKLAALVEEPLVQRHLRVCWENRAPTGNCGECEKCVRTMLILEVNGRIEDFEVFPRNGSLPTRIDGVPSILADLVPVYRAALERTRDRRLKAAVERLIERSVPAQPSWLSRAARRLRPAASR